MRLLPFVSSMEENLFFETVNEALDLLDSYGFSFMQIESGVFILRRYGSEITIRTDLKRINLKMSISLGFYNQEGLFSHFLQINTGDSISISNRIYISFFHDGDIRLGRVVHIDKPIPSSIRDCILDFAESAEKDNEIIRAFLSSLDVVNIKNEQKKENYANMVMGNFLDV